MKIQKQDIFTILGCVGVVGTAVVASIDTAKCEKVKKATFKEKLKANWKHYIPTGIVAIATCGCIIMSNHISHAEIAGLLGTAAYLTANRKQLEKKLKDAVGEETFDKIKSEIEQKQANRELIHHQTIEETGYGNVLCIEGYSGRLFRSSMEHVDEAIMKFKDYFRGNYCCSMNDFYRFLGIEETLFGWQYGYVNNEEWFYDEEGLDIKAHLIPVNEQVNPDPYNEDIYVIDFDPGSYPMECWQEY